MFFPNSNKVSEHKKSDLLITVGPKLCRKSHFLMAETD